MYEGLLSARVGHRLLYLNGRAAFSAGVSAALVIKSHCSIIILSISVFTCFIYKACTFAAFCAPDILGCTSRPNPTNPNFLLLPKKNGTGLYAKARLFPFQDRVPDRVVWTSAVHSLSSYRRSNPPSLKLRAMPSVCFITALLLIGCDSCVI